MDSLEHDEANLIQDKLAGDSPIYQGASITVAQSATLILSFVMRHKLNGECFSDLLTLISLHCLTANSLHSSLYRFKAFFSSLKAPLKFHTYCKKCEYLVDSSNDYCPVCQKELSDKINSSYFVEIPLFFQLSQLFSRKDFHIKLSHRFKRIKKSPGALEDIYDGKLYTRYSSKGGFLDSPDNISLMWFTDGVPLFKSSKVSIWPLFLAINELPIQERFRQENMLFAGLWFGKSKPSMASFLKPFHDSLNQFREEGYHLYCACCSHLVKVCGILLCGTCDLPAKCMVMNMTQFNGRHGCPYCKQEGAVIQSGKGHTRTFPFNPGLIDGPKRSHAEFIKDGEEAFNTGEPRFGVKGPTWWSNCCVDIIAGTASDYMHCVLLGIERRLLHLWFDPKFSDKPFSISTLVSVADSRLAKIQPPYFITRHPRDIKDHSGHWKASECRSWLFFYSVPVLFGLLHKQYYYHYLLLVEAIYTLNLDAISEKQIQRSEELLIKFCGLFATLYGDQHMSANLHQLLHLPDTVRHLGPLWVYSCFPFESLNGKLTSLFHGTQNPVIQIANAVSTMLKLPALSTNMPEGSAIEIFYQKLTTQSYHFKLTDTISSGAYVIGSKHLKKLEMKYMIEVSECLNFPIGSCYMFHRVLKNGILYHSGNYHTFSRNSCTIVYKKNGKRKCGIIMFYLKVNEVCRCESICCCNAAYVAIVRKLEADKTNPFTEGNSDTIKAELHHVITGKLSDETEAIYVMDIVGLAVCIELSPNTICAILRPNAVESD